jgi:hypothetical protein
MRGFKIGDEVVVVSNRRVGKVEHRNQRTDDPMYNVRFENGELLCYEDYALSSVRDFSKDVRLATVSNVRELLLSDEFMTEFTWKYFEAKKFVLESDQPPKVHAEDPSSTLPDPLNCIGNICDLAEPTGVTCPVDSCDLDTGVREMPSPATEYRELTHADLANGPIEVEVCDDKTHESHWKKGVLCAIFLLEDFPYLAKTLDLCSTGYDVWKYARIKVS